VQEIKGEKYQADDQELRLFTCNENKINKSNDKT